MSDFPNLPRATCPECGFDMLLADVVRYSTEDIELIVKLHEDGTFADMVELLSDPDIYQTEITAIFCPDCGFEATWSEMEEHLKRKYAPSESSHESDQEVN